MRYGLLLLLLLVSGAPGCAVTTEYRRASLAVGDWLEACAIQKEAAEAGCFRAGQKTPHPISGLPVRPLALAGAAHCPARCHG